MRVREPSVAGFRAVRALVAVALLVLAVSAFAADITNDVYVWQRQWSPALRRTLSESRGDFSGVRVLVAQAGRDGRWLTTEADPLAFANDPRGRVAVVRYDGAGAPPDATRLAPFLDALAQRWREAGAPLAAIEIDYDCAASRLADYARRLRELRAKLPPGVALSVTALPAWLGARDLDAVLAAVDEPVLQVHAVRGPAHGLFDAAQAERWIRAFAPRAPHGYRVALPAYGMRVRFDAKGHAIAVESEMAVDAAEAVGARELSADPADVVRLLAHLANDPPPGWRGVAWFRLPLPDDRRAWTLAALREVVVGRVPEAKLEAEVVMRENGASDIYIANAGIADADAKTVRVIAGRCTAADALAGWREASAADGRRFMPDAGLRIRANTRRAVGWVRCAGMVEARIE